MKTRYLPIADVIEDISSFRDYAELSVPQVKKIISDFVRKIQTDEQLTHRVCLLQVQDYTVELPRDQSIIMQVCYKDDTAHVHRKKIELSQWSQRALDGSECTYKITAECPDCHKTDCDCRGSYITIDIDDIWRQQHPEYQYMQMDHMYRWGGMNKENIPISNYNHDFRIIRYAQHYFHNADYHINGCLNLDKKLMSNVDVEYTINNGFLKLNKPTGEVLIAYLGQQVDSEGWHLVPDIPEVIEGIKWYYEEMASWKEFRKSKNKIDLSAFQIAQAQRQRLQGIINEKLQTPSFGAWMSFLNNRWKKTGQDHNYYGNMNRFSTNMYEGKLTQLTGK